MKQIPDYYTALGVNANASTEAIRKAFKHLALQYGDGALCHPYELFPLCPHCGKAEWCPAEEERLWNVRDRAGRRAKWRRRFGLE
jgi:hypothetical protein